MVIKTIEKGYSRQVKNIIADHPHMTIFIGTSLNVINKSKYKQVNVELNNIF